MEPELEHAVGYLSAEAITIARLSARPQWRRILQTCLGLRDAAIGRDVQRTVDVMTHFEPAISEARKTYTHLVLFELPKADLDLDEFAFEILRNVGLLIAERCGSSTDLADLSGSRDV